MFRIFAPGNRRRRVWSPTTIALSVVVHGLFFYGVGWAAGSDPPPLSEHTHCFFGLPPEPPPLPWPGRATSPAPREEPRQPPKTGGSRGLQPPDGVPGRIAAPGPGQPVDFLARGVPGDGVGPVVPGEDHPLAGSTEDEEPTGDGGVLVPETVEEFPEVRNRCEMVNLLERTYPGTLRDAGMEGRVVVQLVVDTEGRVEPESIRIVSSTHAAFEAPSRRAAARMRFRPARVDGLPVRVVILIPVEWKVPD